MSGVEFIVGVVLGSVPLAVTILEKYAVFSEGLSMFRNPKEVIKLQTMVLTQKTIFRNTAINLLSAITDDQYLVKAIISELAQTARDPRSSLGFTERPIIQTARELKMGNVYHNRIDSLEESFQRCSQTVGQIVAALESLMVELSRIAEPVEKAKSGSSTTATQDWLLRRRSGLKLAFRKPGLVKAIEDIIKFNSSFDTIANQIISGLSAVKKGTSRQETVVFKKTASNINTVEKYRQIRHASAALYETLANAWTCVESNHHGHAASMCCVDALETKRVDSITFRVVLTVCELSSQSPPDDKNPLWLEVEHCETGNAQNPVAIIGARQETLGDLESVLTKHTEQFASEKFTSWRAKSVHFETATPNSSNNNAQDLDNQSLDSDIELINLTLVTDICHYVHCHYLEYQPRQCFGYLEGRYHQRFYRPPPDRGCTGNPILLSSIISWFNQFSFQGSLPLPAAFHIATSLAMSVLQFHSTAWLPETWRSEDITFFSGQELSVANELQLSYPYFKIVFAKRQTAKDKKGKDKAIDSHQNPPEQQPGAITGGARNELLFRLGTVLIEVGFSCSWEELRARACTEFNLPPNKQTDYLVAETLCSVLTRHMGPDYSRIVRKCIGCDFGLREPQIDLVQSEELQTVFLSDVISKLHRMKESAEALGGR